MDAEWLRAVPIGLVLFAGSAFAAWSRRRRRARAQQNYPALAEQLGLKLDAPRYPGWAGTLRGSYAGRAVLVQPDEQARIVVQLTKPCGVELRSFAHWKRAPVGYENFAFAARRINEWLANRYVKHELLTTWDPTALGALLDKLQSSSPALRQFSVDAERIECLFVYGSPAFIPVEEVPRLLTLLGQLALALEQQASLKADV
jgi:hypothetical protein